MIELSGRIGTVLFDILKRTAGYTQDWSFSYGMVRPERSELLLMMMQWRSFVSLIWGVVLSFGPPKGSSWVFFSSVFFTSIILTVDWVYNSLVEFTYSFLYLLFVLMNCGFCHLPKISVLFIPFIMKCK